MPNADPILQELYRHRFEGVADEMGVTLRRTSYSPNIKERLDFSCAVFDGDGALVAQAAHIPVHLGAMPASVDAARAAVDHWAKGDVVVLNDPYKGGTHLPDVTMVSPVFVGDEAAPSFFVASRAHHADVGGMTPGSLPLATELVQEGLVIPPVKLYDGGTRNDALLRTILRNVRTPAERRGERRTRAALADWPEGTYTFADELEVEDDETATIRVTATVGNDTVTFDFEGTDDAVDGNLNAVLPITESACYYVVQGLTGGEIPVNAGSLALVSVTAPTGTLVNAEAPHAVAGGNVETSQRIVDAVLGALAHALPDRVPAAGQGTMNNLTLGGTGPEGSSFAYYETIGGGMGAGPNGEGLSGVHVHMTNTLNTPVEALEQTYPFRIVAYQVRPGSGGAGRVRGGDGLVRVYELLVPTTATILSTRRTTVPWGHEGGHDGAPGRTVLIHPEGTKEELPAHFSRQLPAGSRLRIETPGGGGFGSPYAPTE
ncbi:MAG: 5-oxoprolinase [Bacteroidetes bacterium QS_3_64_15]|nr:MAG: 5-oxoprolinase [Bacteroidetes bacterium QS_3_64_15]